MLSRIDGNQWETFEFQRRSMKSKWKICPLPLIKKWYVCYASPCCLHFLWCSMEFDRLEWLLNMLMDENKPFWIDVWGCWLCANMFRHGSELFQKFPFRLKMWIVYEMTHVCQHVSTSINLFKNIFNENHNFSSKKVTQHQNDFSSKSGRFQLLWQGKTFDT